MQKKKSSKKSVKKSSKKPGKNEKVLKDESTLYAFVATFFSIFGFIIALLFWKDNDYVMFYAKQSLVLFIFAILVYLVNVVLFLIPIIGWGIMVVLHLVTIVLWVISWIYAMSGEIKELPIIGGFAKNFKL